jgi:hypothetical protein
MNADGNELDLIGEFEFDGQSVAYWARRGDPNGAEMSLGAADMSVRATVAIRKCTCSLGDLVTWGLSPQANYCFYVEGLRE